MVLFWFWFSFLSFFFKISGEVLTIQSNGSAFRPYISNKSFPKQYNVFVSRYIVGGLIDSPPALDLINS